jgi:hypothetical protein
MFVCMYVCVYVCLYVRTKLKFINAGECNFVYQK